ncbi:hypothetical protein RSAG8_04818, partial [Rhizoctonia solani AG-8 WAC10335]
MNSQACFTGDRTHNSRTHSSGGSRNRHGLARLVPPNESRRVYDPYEFPGMLYRRQNTDERSTVSEDPPRTFDSSISNYRAAGGLPIPSDSRPRLDTPFDISNWPYWTAKSGGSFTPRAAPRRLSTSKPLIESLNGRVFLGRVEQVLTRSAVKWDRTSCMRCLDKQGLVCTTTRRRVPLRLTTRRRPRHSIM